MRSPPIPIIVSQTRRSTGHESAPGRRTVMNPDAAFPFVDFSMAVSERKTAGVVMKWAAIVHSVRALCYDRARRVVDGPRIIIDENPHIGRRRETEVAEFAKSSIWVVGDVRVLAVQPWTIHFFVTWDPALFSDYSSHGSNTLLHGDTANGPSFGANQLRRIGIGVIDDARVAGALIN